MTQTSGSLVQAGIFVAEGVDKIRLTGGEPTLRKDLEPIARELGALPGLKTLAMTSNGVALRRKLQPLAAAGLSALNISLDTLHEDRFEQLTRRKGCRAVLDCVEEALATGYTVKVNVVVMRGINEDEIGDFVELTRRRRLNVRFIEYMPFDDNAWSKDKMVRLCRVRTCFLCCLPATARDACCRSMMCVPAGCGSVVSLRPLRRGWRRKRLLIGSYAAHGHRRQRRRERTATGGRVPSGVCMLGHVTWSQGCVRGAGAIRAVSPESRSRIWSVVVLYVTVVASACAHGHGCRLLLAVCIFALSPMSISTVAPVL